MIFVYFVVSSKWRCYGKEILYSSRTRRWKEHGSKWNCSRSRLSLLNCIWSCERGRRLLVVLLAENPIARTGLPNIIHSATARLWGVNKIGRTSDPSEEKVVYVLEVALPGNRRTVNIHDIQRRQKRCRRNRHLHSRSRGPVAPEVNILRLQKIHPSMASFGVFPIENLSRTEWRMDCL